MSNTEFTLNTGAKIPAVAFGTYKAYDQESYDSVREALKVGYRHIDAAFFYKNEEAVGRAIRDSGIPREELFVVTKVWPTHLRDPEAALDRSLKLLGLDYVDMYLMHWPFACKPDPNDVFSQGLGEDKDWSVEQSWELMEKLPKTKTKAVGVSNFTVKVLQGLLDSSLTKTVPAANQCEFHPELPQQELVDFCHKNKIVPEAYAPLARGQVNNPVIVAIAEKHGVDPGQVVLSWNVQRGVVVLPKSVTPKRIASNFKIIKLDDDDMAKIAELGKNPKRLIGTEGIYGRDIFSD